MQLTNNIYQALDDVDLAFQDGRISEIIETMVFVKRMSGIVLAKAIYLEHSTYEGTEPFQEYASARYGIGKPYVKRCRDVWSAILKAPEELQKLLVKKDMKSLIPIGTNLANGEVAEEELDWDRIINSATHGEVSSYLRDVKGVEDNPDRIDLYIDWNTGDIHAYHQNERYFIGYLDLHAKDHPIISKAINRVINKSGIR